MGPAADVIASHPDARLVDLGRSVVMPGFVNCHSHIEYTSFRGILDDAEFGDWIISLVDVKAALTPEEYVASARLGAIEAIASGITTIADTSYGGYALEAAAEAGLRGRLYLEVFGVDDKHLDDTLADVERRLDAALAAGAVHHRRRASRRTRPTPPRAACTRPSPRWLASAASRS